MISRRVFISPGALILISISFVCIVFAFAWLAKTSATVSNLDKTDRIACKFLLADSRIKNKQVQETREGTIEAENTFIEKANALLKVFEKIKNPAADVIVFRDYVRSMRDLQVKIRESNISNSDLSRNLAIIGEGLADQLNC